jgi:hypothetical protein
MMQSLAEDVQRVHQEWHELRIKKLDLGALDNMIHLMSATLANKML